MKGTTHTAIGVTAANIAGNISLTAVMSTPLIGLQILSAYVGALFCDLDIGSSTISNKLTFIKAKHFKKIMSLAYVLGSAGALLYFATTQYLIYVVAGVIAAGLTLSSITSSAYKLVRKVCLIGVAAAAIAGGVIYKQPPVILLGVVLGAMIFSPHRAYSHSLVAVLICYFTFRYIQNYYNIPNISFFFILGMLSHILSDMFTNKGVMLFFPYPKRIALPWTITTGSTAEKVLTIIFTVTAGITFFYGFTL